MDPAEGVDQTLLALPSNHFAVVDHLFRTVRIRLLVYLPHAARIPNRRPVDSRSVWPVKAGSMEKVRRQSGTENSNSPSRCDLPTNLQREEF